MDEECEKYLRNLGITKCNKVFQTPKLMIEVPMDFEMTEVEIANPAIWKTKLLQIVGRIYKWPNFDTIEEASTEAIYQQSVLTDQFVNPGKYGWRFGFSVAMCLHRAMFSHSGNRSRILLVDRANQVMWTKKSNGKYTGIQTSLLNVEKLKINDGAVVTTTPVYVVVSETNEIDETGYIMKVPFIGELSSIIDVSIVVQELPAPIATAIVVKVFVECDGTPITGLLPADFILKDVNGDAQVIVTAPEDAQNPGTYTLTGVGLESGTLTLKSAATLSVQPYELPAPVVVVI